MIVQHENKPYLICDKDYEFYVVNKDKNIKTDIIIIEELDSIPLQYGDVIIQLFREDKEILVIELLQLAVSNNILATYKTYYDIDSLKYFINDYEKIINKRIEP